MNKADPHRGQWPPGCLLARLPPASVARLLSLGALREFRANQTLLRQGDRSTHALLLLSGYVKVTATTSDGRLALLAVRVGGDLVGEFASIDDEPRSATVTTVSVLRARVITQPVFREFLGSDPAAALAISQSVTAKVRWATRRRVEFGSCEVKVRLARVLVELADSYGQVTPEGIEIGVAITQPELAALVGAAEPTVHRALADLRRKRVVVTGYRRTTINDYAALRALCES